MDEFIKEEGKLGHGFASVDVFEEIDLGDREKPRPTYISAKLDPEYRHELIKLLREYKDCFLGNIMKCLVLTDLLWSIGCLLSQGLGRISNILVAVILRFCLI